MTDQPLPPENQVPLDQGEIALPEMQNGFPPGFGPNVAGASGIPGAIGAPIQHVPPGPYPPPITQLPPAQQAPHMAPAQQIPMPQPQPQIAPAPEPAPEHANEPGVWKYPNSVNEELFESPEDVPADISAFFPEGVTRDHVEEWKRAYKEVYMVVVMGRAWFYRPLTRNEYLAIMANRQDQFQNEEAITATALIWPKPSILDLRADSAGIASSISDYVMKMSGFAPTSIPVKL